MLQFGRFKRLQRSSLLAPLPAGVKDLPGPELGGLRE